MKTTSAKSAFPSGRWTTQLPFKVNSRPDLENRLRLQKLAFERAIERYDINAANIACGRMDYLQREIELLAVLKVQVGA